MRPSAPNAELLRRSNPWPWVALAVIAGLVGSIAVAAFLSREKPQDLVIPAPTDTPSPAESGPKIAERVGGATPSPTPSDTSSPAPAPTPAATASPTPTPTPSAGSTATPTPAPTPTPSASAAPSAVLPIAARAAMLIATTADPQKPAVTLGTVVWSSVPAISGQPGSVGVKAEVDVVDLKMHATMTLRKNVDAALPASHTIDLRVTFEDGAPVKGVKDIDIPRMRREDSPSSDPLLGVSVKINDAYFLIGLNRADADAAHNLDEIATHGWFDFPMILADGRIAKLTFEKGSDGDRVVADVLAAWK